MGTRHFVINCLLGLSVLGVGPVRRARAAETLPNSAEDASVQDAAPTDGTGERSGDLVTSPRPLNTPVEPIPATTEKVEIVLELVVDRAGHVTSARAVSGSEPFASRATDATRAWTFAPATKGGVLVAARLAFLVTFEPAPRPDKREQRGASKTSGVNSTAAEGQPAVSQKALASAVPIAEVLILGDLPDPGARGFTRQEARKLAGAFDDPLRSLEVLPGVTPILTGLPMFFVRGAPPGNVGYFLDGIRIPQLYHAFLGPSVLHPAFVSQVELHAGPMPARFGRYAGAAVDAHLAQPQGQVRGEANVRLLDAGAFMEAPFAGGRGYALVGGRYSYTALILTLLSPNQRLDYWDYQAMAGYKLGHQDELRLLTFGAFDYVGSGTGIQAGVEFHRVDLAYTHDFSPLSKVRLSATVGSDRTRSAFGFVGDMMFASRVAYTLKTEAMLVRAGGDFVLDDYSTEIAPAVTEPEVYRELFPARTDAAGGAYVDFVLFPDSPIRVTPGLRADVYSTLGQVAVGVDPRLSAEYMLRSWLKATHSVGLAHQLPSFVPNIPGAQVGGLRGGLQENLQAATSYEFKLPLELTASVGGFVNVTSNLSDPIGGSQTLAVDETSADTQVLGRAAGLELFVKRPLTRRLGGLISYTFSQTLRSGDVISTIAGYDRPHVLNAALTYDLGRHWQASGKLALASGIPGRRTTLDGFVFDGSRSAPLARLDVKLTKRWYVSEHFNWGVHAEVLNATYAGTVSRRTCGRRGCEDEGTAPILIPSVGVDGSWN